ncbi:Murein L,D-transpeptidase YcbB/YkuD [bacterium A37T11]|nr:Murein L,D-transpeptidase YcbB/YkuD [bacterium A37T11]
MKHPWWCLFVLVLLSACHQKSPNNKRPSAASLRREALKQWDKTIPGNFSPQTSLRFDSTYLRGFLEQYPDMVRYESDIRKFYSKRQYAFAWFDGKGLIEPAGNLSDRILNLAGEGLNKSTPYQAVLDSLIHNYRENSGAHKASKPLELMLTAQYFAFAKLAWQGIDESPEKANDWFVPRKKVSYEQYLDSMLQQKPNHSHNAYKDPVYRQYDHLRAFISQYKHLDERGVWPAINLDKSIKSFKYGDSSETLVKIRRRLYALGDLKSDTLSPSYDSTLFKAMQQFQERHGINPDGAIGPGTLSELNISPNQRLRQIIVNMERSRWLPASQQGEYLGVNIPEFKLHIYRDDSLLWSTNVVVGKALHETVIFSGNVKYVVFSPYWNVPPSIVKAEIVPGMKRNSNYLIAHHMEVTGNSGGLPVVRQKPGPANSLGLVKFLFPNSHNIYLHDSPAKSLYNETSRAFSHGCIRVSEPKRLAEFLLKKDSTWTAESIDKAMHLGKEKTVTLKQTVPVFIAYFTAFVDRRGRLNFRKDIYKRDERLAELLLNANNNSN